MSKIDLNNKDILSSREAARIWNVNADYVRTSIKQSPNKWPAGSWRKFGRQIVVTAEGMEKATGKKDPRKNKVFKNS